IKSVNGVDYEYVIRQKNKLKRPPKRCRSARVRRSFAFLILGNYLCYFCHTLGSIKFGGFTPFKPASMFLAASSDIFSSVSCVDEPTCGVVTTFFMFNNRLSGWTGSCSNTSNRSE